MVAKKESKGGSVLRTKKVKFLRYVLRRKQCSFILIAELAFFISLTLLSTSFYFWRMDFVTTRVKLEIEHERLHENQDEITFGHCKYRKPECPDNPFNLKMCRNRYAELAIAYRLQNLSSNADGSAQDPTCLPLNEAVFCHEHLIDLRKGDKGFARQHHRKVHNLVNECPALGVLSALPVFKNEEMTRFLNLTVLSSELIYRCPRCDARNLEGQCITRQTTQTAGFPYFVEYCKDTIKDNSKCHH